MTIQHEKPELEVKKTELLKKEEDLKVQLAELEESLLEVRYPTYSYICIVLENGKNSVLNEEESFYKKIS